MELSPAIQAVFRKTALEFYLNGTKIELSDPNPQWTLLDFIRSQHGLKGTKLGCGEGGCGACTVVLQNLDESKERKGRVKHLAVNACLFPLIGGETSPRDEGLLTSGAEELTHLQWRESMLLLLKGLAILRILILYKRGWPNFMAHSEFT